MTRVKVLDCDSDPPKEVTVSVQFNANEALDLAVQIEVKAEAFYRAAADACDDIAAQRMFLDLASMEKQHAQIFDAIRGHTDPRGGPPRVGTLDRSWPIVSNALIDNINASLPQTFRGKKTMSEILQGAMEVERDTIVFFTWIKEMVAQGPDKALLDDILKEEMGHLITLGSQLATA
jgi:rubrerythrin